MPNGRRSDPVCAVVGGRLQLGGPIAQFPAEPDAPPFKLCVVLFKFLDLYELIFPDVGECLVGIRHRPPDFQTQDSRVLPESNMLLQRRGPERSTAPDSSINRTT